MGIEVTPPAETDRLTSESPVAGGELIFTSDGTKTTVSADVDRSQFEIVQNYTSNANTANRISMDSVSGLVTGDVYLYSETFLAGNYPQGRAGVETDGVAASGSAFLRMENGLGGEVHKLMTGYGANSTPILTNERLYFESSGGAFSLGESLFAIDYDGHGAIQRGFEGNVDQDASGDFIWNGQTTADFFRIDASADLLDVRGPAIFNEAGSSTADFRIEGASEANLFFTDASADFVGIGTSTPAERLDIFHNSTPQVRVSYDGSNYADIGATSGGRMSLSSSGSTQKWVQFGSHVQGRGLSFFMDTAADQFWIRLDRDEALDGLDMLFNVRSGQDYTWMVNFSTQMALSSTGFSTNVPATFQINDASTNTVLESLTVNRLTTGTAAAGMGAGFSFRMENASGSPITNAFWETFWTNASAGSETSTTRMRVLNSGNYVDSNRLFVISGEAEAVGVGISDSDIPEGKFEVSNSTTAGEQLVTLDQNDTDQPFFDFQGTAGANTTDSISTHGTAGTIQGWVQVEINGTKRWIPFYDDPSA